jgi:putative zinc finger/helix-turn-helix YgiT family protein
MRENICPNCNLRGKIRKGKYHYTESGLRNVWLMGVEIFICECGETFAFIPCPQELHKLIARILLRKEDQLTGREICFLRKHMGLKAKDFAKQVGVQNVTISRWEHGDTIPPESIDRLIRFFYATEMNLYDVALEIKKINFRKHVKGQEESPIIFPIEQVRKDTCESIA